MKKLMEINVKAKPHNPAEDVLGTELLWVFAECQLVGWHYFGEDVPPNKGREVIALVHPGQFSPTILKIQKGFGWTQIPAPPSFEYLTFIKQVDKGTPAEREDKLHVFASCEGYDKWTAAAEVCKMFKPVYPDDLQNVRWVHSIIMDGMKLKLDKKGAILGVEKPKPPINNLGPINAAPQGWAAGHGGGFAAAFNAIVGNQPIPDQWPPAPEEELGPDGPEPA